MEDERTTNPNKTVVTVLAQQPKKADAKDACLVVIYGEDLGRRIPLGSEPCVIGRSSKCDVQIDQESVSRNHARLSRGPSGYYARDLGSTNGTYVNDELIDEVMLRDGDQVKVGRTIFKFIVGGNIENLTRVMTTAIALETSKGDLPLALGLGLVLIALTLAINAVAFGASRIGARYAG